MKIEDFLSYFDEVKDPQIERNKKHILGDILIIAVLSFICGNGSWEEIEDFGKANETWLKESLSLPNWVPSHDTFARLFARLNPTVFQTCFIDLTRSWMKKSEGQFVAIDGKTLRRSHDRKKRQHPLHRMSAWACQNRLTLGQVKTSGKSNEIPAIKQLLDLIDIKGCTVTIDAMGCQKAIAEQIKAVGGDYLLAVKGNQGRLHQRLISLFDRVKQTHYDGILFSEETTLDGDHSRIETRKYTVLPSMYHFGYQKQWKGIQSFIRVESRREKAGKISLESRYYISSLKPDAALLGQGIRQHWRIENTLQLYLRWRIATQTTKSDHG